MEVKSGKTVHGYYRQTTHTDSKHASFHPAGGSLNTERKMQKLCNNKHIYDDEDNKYVYTRRSEAN